MWPVAVMLSVGTNTLPSEPLEAAPHVKLIPLGSPTRELSGAVTPSCQATMLASSAAYSRIACSRAVRVGMRSTAQSESTAESGDQWKNAVRLGMRVAIAANTDDPSTPVPEHSRDQSSAVRG